MTRNHHLAMLLLFCICAAPLLAGKGGDSTLVHKEHSVYRNLYIYEEQKDGHMVRCLRFLKVEQDGGGQSCIYLDDPRKMFFSYTKLMLGGLYLNPQPQRILIIGLGGGVLPKALAQLRPGAEIVSVEIDPAVTRIAKEWFGFEAGPRNRVEEMDGRVFVKRAQRQGEHYDLIMLDAFNGDYIPEHLLTREFLEEVRSLLGPDGVMVANTFSDSRLYDSESVTYQAVFGEFYNVKRANRVIYWRNGGLPKRLQILDNARQMEGELGPFGVETAQVVSLFSSSPDWDPEAPLLTDQYSPSNLMRGL